MERTGEVSAATLDPRDKPSFSFLALSSEYPIFFMAATEGQFYRDILTPFVTNEEEVT